MTLATNLPRIHLIEKEADQLMQMADNLESRDPELAALLAREVERAETHAPADLPAGVVSIGAFVEFIDDGNGTYHTLQLVYPQDADISAGRMSVLTHVGAGLIGLSEGQEIHWPDRNGHERRLRIIRVISRAH